MKHLVRVKRKYIRCAGYSSCTCPVALAIREQLPGKFKEAHVFPYSVELRHVYTLKEGAKCDFTPIGRFSKAVNKRIARYDAGQGMTPFNFVLTETPRKRKQTHAKT